MLNNMSDMSLILSGKPAKQPTKKLKVINLDRKAIKPRKADSAKPNTPKKG